MEHFQGLGNSFKDLMKVVHTAPTFAEMGQVKSAVSVGIRLLKAAIVSVPFLGQ